MSESNSWEAITSTADSDANSEGALGNDDANDLAETPLPTGESEEASWFGIGGLGIAALSLAQGVASAIHQTAVNVAEELAEMERLADQELEEEEEARRRRRCDGATCSTRYDNDDEEEGGEAAGTTTGRQSEDATRKLPLPWQVPSTRTHHCKTTRVKPDNGNIGLSLVEDEQLKAMIMDLALAKSTFEGPFLPRTKNDGGDDDDDDDDDAKSYFTEERVELIERMLDIDKNLAKAHALCASSAMSEELFFRNYFYHIDEIRANYTIRDEELDIDIVLQTPPPSPEQQNRPLIPAMPAPRNLSVDDLVLVGMGSENGDEVP